jgi:hypothetical protein
MREATPSPPLTGHGLAVRLARRGQAASRYDDLADSSPLARQTRTTWPRLRAFFATLHYAGPRPEEAVALGVSESTLPLRGWGEFVVRTTEPEVGSPWTDDGEVHETRHLKGTVQGEQGPYRSTRTWSVSSGNGSRLMSSHRVNCFSSAKKGAYQQDLHFRRTRRNARKEVLSHYRLIRLWETRL